MKRTLIIIISFLLPLLTDAQDTVRVSRIYFKHGYGGAIIKKEIIIDGEQGNDQKRVWRTRSKDENRFDQTKGKHLAIGSGTDAGIVKVVLPNYTDFKNRTLTIHSLSGIQFLSTSISAPFTTIDPRPFPSGVYIITLILDGEKEILRICN